MSKTPFTHPDLFTIEDAILYNTLTHQPQSVDEIVKDMRERIIGQYFDQRIQHFVTTCNQEEIVRRLQAMGNIVKQSPERKFYVLF